MKNIKKKVERMTEFIQDLLEKQNSVGLSICVVHENDSIYSKAFGMSRLHPTPVKMTPDTIMSIQSVSKNFMAVSILQLCDKGLTSLDHPLVHYLPYFKTKNKAVSDKITIRQVLSHTAGFPFDLGIANMIAPNVREIFSDTPTEFDEALQHYHLTENEINQIGSREDITRWFSKVELEYEPGAGWNYCTDAYVLLADLFEKVSGQSWETHLHENILNRLKMDSTTHDYRVVKQNPNSCRYYLGENETETPFPINPISAPIGFLYSTANDLGKYLLFHMNQQSAILTAKSIQEMQVPVSRVSHEWNEGDSERSYGLGWFIGKYKENVIIEHSGGQLAVRSLISFIPDKKIGIVVLMNFDGNLHKTINRKIIDICLSE